MRMANPRKGMLASTHLVLQTPEGSKYQAAQKWGLPAVTLRWVLQSARTGRRAEEGRFLVDLPPSPGQRAARWVISPPSQAGLQQNTAQSLRLSFSLVICPSYIVDAYSD